MIRCCLFGLLCLLLTSAHAQFDPQKVPFPITLNGKPVPYTQFSYFAMPGEALELKVRPPADTPVVLHLKGEVRQTVAAGTWRWQAPDEPGHYPLQLEGPAGLTVAVNVFVKRSMAEVDSGMLNGYRIGQYPTRPFRDNPNYLPPPGFVEVTADMIDLPVSPHFTLGQFLCKQQPDHWPKYLVLQPALLHKLELLLETVNASGIRTDSFHVMSGFRTPWYNARIGNGVNSRHVWGAAADIFIDNSGDGRMDDLTGSGRSELADARVLQELVEHRFADTPSNRLVGGLGLYGPRPHRGPFVHVDVRGFEARWEFP